MKPAGGSWQPVPAELESDKALQAAVVEEHRRICIQYFADDLSANHALPILDARLSPPGRVSGVSLLTPGCLRACSFRTVIPVCRYHRSGMQKPHRP